MIRIALILAALLASAPTLAQEGPSASLGCYGELGASGTSTTIDKETQRSIKQMGVGTGCNVQAGTFVVGGGLRLDTGAGGRSASVTAKAGVPINSGLFAYGLAAYSMDAGQRLDANNGVLAAGLGVEIALSKNLAGYFELQKDIARLGTAKSLDEQTVVRAGVRVYLGK